MILASILVSLAASPGRAACDLRPAEVTAVAGDGSLLLKDGTSVQLSGLLLPSGAGLEAARRKLGELLSDPAIRIGGAGPADRYNRVHATVFLGGGLSLQWNLVAEGLARVRPFPGEELCGDNLLLAEDAARTGGFGLWGSHEYAIWRADDPSLPGQIGLYAVVEGRVVSVGAGSRIVFLDFGRNWRRDFTIMVAASASDRFAAAGKKLESLATRVVRARGVIEESNGPAMRIDDPEAIEVLDDDAK